MTSIIKIKPNKLSADKDHIEITLMLTLSDSSKVTFPEPYRVRLYMESVHDVKVISGGRGYAAGEETVSFPAPATGHASDVTAVGRAVLNSGKVTKVDVTTPGKGYRSAPVPTFVQPAAAGGQQANGTSLLGEQPDDFSGYIVEQKGNRVFVAIENFTNNVYAGDWVVELSDGTTSIQCDPDVCVKVKNDPDSGDDD